MKYKLENSLIDFHLDLEFRSIAYKAKSRKIPKSDGQ